MPLVSTYFFKRELNTSWLGGSDSAFVASGVLQNERKINPKTGARFFINRIILFIYIECVINEKRAKRIGKDSQVYLTRHYFERIVF